MVGIVVIDDGIAHRVPGSFWPSAYAVTTNPRAPAASTARRPTSVIVFSSAAAVRLSADGLGVAVEVSRARPPGGSGLWFLPLSAPLEVLYRATDGPEWRDRTNWLSAASLADWHGVTNPELAELGNLRELDLRENRLRRQAGLRTARGPGEH